ncbi:MAG: response regulator [Candidatus Moraniibacteriota bacterium]
MDKNIRLLLVDDDEEMRNIYAEILAESNFTVRQAGNGLEALEEIDKETPDLIFTGIIMPKMDGFTLVEALRKNVVTSHIPIVFLSHLGRKEDEDRAKELGVNDFIVRDTTSPREVVVRLKAQLSATHYILALDSKSYDGQKFARDMGINSDFICTSGEGERYVLRLKQTNPQEKRFDAELICT